MSGLISLSHIQNGEAVATADPRHNGQPSAPGSRRDVNGLRVHENDAHSWGICGVLGGFAAAVMNLPQEMLPFDKEIAPISQQTDPGNCSSPWAKSR
ncbi:MAG: hypothetical protein JSS02_23645 [Planctomycetes bacterium]|nr:hypothetical protein [Planctomycetota bacterium]